MTERTTMRGAAWVGLVCLGMPVSAQAGSGGDAALYDPAPPAGSAFVRVAPSAIDEVALSVRVGSTSPSLSVSGGKASAYVAVPAGPTTVEVASIRGDSRAVEAGRYYTVVYNGKTQRWLEDPAPGSRAKASLVLYNFSAEPLDLVTADGATVLLDEVAVGQVAARGVNGVAAALGVSADQGVLATTPTLSLRNGATYSLFASPAPGGGLSLRWQENATAPIARK